MASELKLCPFCHKTSHLKIDPFYEPSFDGYYGFNVVCSAAGFDNTDRGCGAAGAWGETEEDAATRWNTRPAPAATDTGLVTVAYRYRHVDYVSWAYSESKHPRPDIESEELVTFSQAGAIIAELQAKAKDYREYSERLEKRLEREEATRSQAEELLAAERAKYRDAMEKLVESQRETLVWQQRAIDLKADNAAKDARIKELSEALDKQRELDNESTLYHYNRAKALKAKLSAAEAGRDRVRRIFRRNTRLRFEAEKRAEAMEAKRADAEKSAFEHGYVMACCNIVNLHDEPTIAHCTLSELGVTRAAVKTMNLSEYDLKALRKIERDRSRSPYAKANRKARAVLGGKP